MPRFNDGGVNIKLEKGDIILMGNPTQYGEILAENLLVEDITKANLQTLISASELVRGKFYRITNAVSSTLSLLVQGLTANTICDYAYNTANGELVAYNITTDLASVPFSSAYVPYTGATTDVNLGANDITANAIIKSGGTSAQFLKADGSVDSTDYYSTNSEVTSQPLTGLSVSGSAIVSTDSILTALGKAQNQINAVVGSVNFQGVWNASTNSPSLASGVGTKGYYYIVTVAGSTNLNGITDWKLGDWAIYDGTAWQKVDNTDAVVSVNGYTGIVTLAAADVGALPTSAISGTTGKLAKFTSSGAVGDSIVSESGGALSIGGTLQINVATGYNALFQQSGTDLRINYLNQDLSANVSASYRAVGYNWQDNGGSSIMSLSATELITFGATDTGEAHIFGGSARVNGTQLVTGAATFSSSVTTGGIATLGSSAGNGTANAWSVFRGVGVSDGSGVYGNYGGFILNANNEYSASAKQFLITNAYNTNSFAIIRSTNATTPPTLGTGGAVTSGVVDFSISNTGAATFSSSVTAGSATFLSSVTAGDSITSTLSSGEIFRNVVAGMGVKAMRFASTGADAYWGIESSTAGGFFTGSSAYATVLYSSTPQEFIVAATKILTLGTSGSVFSGSVTAGGITITSGNILNVVSGDIYIQEGGRGILSPNAQRLLNIQNGLLTISGRLNISALPTSAAGLSAGDIWSDNGTLKIV